MLAHNRDDRGVVHLRVIQPVQKVDGARAGGGQADANLAGELRMAACHERRHLLMSDLDEVHLVARPIQRPKDAVDAVPRITVDARYAPFSKALDQEITTGFSHPAIP